MVVFWGVSTLGFLALGGVSGIDVTESGMLLSLDEGWSWGGVGGKTSGEESIEIIIIAR